MLSKSKSQTQKFAAKLALKFLNSKFPILNSRIIALHGDLGAGKTAFVQGFLKALGVKQHITSPTFLIIRKYEISTPLKQGLAHFHHAYHLDLYRIQKPKELLDLGFKKVIQDPRAIILIEWPERVKKLLPKKNLTRIILEHGKTKNERIIKIKHKT